MLLVSFAYWFLASVAALGPAAGAVTGVEPVGSEVRQDDFPSVAPAPDGSLWVAWLSFEGNRDDVAIRRYQNGKWGNLLWVPGTSGDSFLPQVGVDPSGRVWVVWSQQVGGNWDLYARRFDPARQEWSPMERLTSDPLPDINPQLASNGRGHFALVWQGFRGRNSNIFMKTFDGGRWSGDLRITDRAANDWDPAAAIDSKGAVWIAYDTYKNGNYDVFMQQVRNGELQGQEMAVASTPAFEARASVTVDTADRVWVAWEAGLPNWGKDQGYVIRRGQPGVPLGGFREPRIRCLEGGRWREPEARLTPAFPAGNIYGPRVFSDAHGSVWVAANIRKTFGSPSAPSTFGYWEYWITRLEANGWSEAFALPNSRGRSSTRLGAATGTDGNLWVVWPTDSRMAFERTVFDAKRMYHRPIRQQIFAGTVTIPSSVVPVLKLAGEPSVEAKPGHENEARDVQMIRAYTAMINGKPHHIVRGDFHRHTELSWDGDGVSDGSLPDFYRYMIDAASMDFGASTDHQGGAWPYWWWYTQKMTDMYNVPGAFVPIFGFERSAQFPFGHRNVFYAQRSDARVIPFFLKEGVRAFGLPRTPQGDEPGIGTDELVANDARLLYEEIQKRNGLTIPHTTATRMGTDWRDNDPELEPVVEIYQGARTNYEALGAPLVADPSKDQAHIQGSGYQPEGMVANAWNKGYKLGITASSDHGSTHISYAMVYTDDPTRRGILDAIRKRHTYGAMDNIILEVRLGEHFMGDEFSLAKVQPLRIKVRGTRRVTRVDVIKNNQVIYSTQPNRQDVEFEFLDKVRGSDRHFCYVRVQQEDGMLAWSSPMFINYK